MSTTLPVFLAALCGTAFLGWGTVRGATPPVSDKHTAGQTPPTSADPAEAGTPVAPKADLPQTLGKRNWGVLEKYCLDCHNVEDWEGGVAFDSMSIEQIPQDAQTWETVIRKLRGSLMPPPGKDRPDEKDVRGLIGWLETTLDEHAEAHPHPGRVVLHRLNRKEYANAVQDLLALSIDPEAILPRDDVHDGFDNVAHALQVSPSFMDQYLSAARTVAVQALGNRQARPVGTIYTAQGSGNQQFHREGLPFGTRGGIAVEHYFPADGEYALNIANMAQALWVYNMEFDNTLVATLDGKEFFRTNIGGEEDMKSIDQKQDPAVDAINKRLKNIRFNATAGSHKVAVTFLHRSFAESEDRLQMFTPGGGQDRVLRVSSFEIRGPFTTTGISATPSREKVFTCYPQAGASAADERACAEKIIGGLAARAFRRPLEPGDLPGLMQFYDSGRKEGDFEAGVRRSLTAVLASPDFLYRTELGRPSDAPVRDLTDVELASRLSFFLWSSVPDEQLLTLATQGRLADRAVLEQQIRRMLADPRAETLVTNFAFQWLNVAKLEEIDPDSRIFPYASGQADPRPLLREELRLFIGSILREDRNVTELLTAKHTFVNERLALHYGIGDVKGDRFRRVDLEQSARWGLLGKGGILMMTSYPTRTAPVLRGAYILERITGTPPTPPPPNVEALKENQAGTKVLTIRERMAQHSQSPTCHGCHGVLDPLGFALENFDAVGQFRTVDREARTPIDSTGLLPDGTAMKGADDLRAALLRYPDQFVQTMTEKLMTYALGRAVEYHDMPTVRAVVREAAKHDYRFSALVLGIVTSDAFRKTMAPQQGEGTTKQAAVQSR